MPGASLSTAPAFCSVAGLAGQERCGQGPDLEIGNVMNEGPLVSVILPVYNGEAFAAAAVESALRQTYRNLEIIIVDDGSHDNTLAALEAKAAGDSRIRIIRQPNGGVARARNRGLAEAKGEFIAPLDADDLWEPTKIEREVRRMLDSGPETGLVYCWWVWIDAKGTLLDRSPSWAIEGSALQTLLQVNFTGNSSVPLFRRRCLEEVGGYDEEFEQSNGRGCEDWDLALRVAARYSVAVVPAVLVGYRRRPRSMSTDWDAMRRSQELVAGGLRRRHPGLPPGLFRHSEEQFALYLAGVLFWSGAYLRAVKLALRAWRSGLLFDVLPYVMRVVLRRLSFRWRAQAQTMAPGVALDAGRIPETLVPYDRIYARRMQNTVVETARGTVRAGERPVC